MAPVQSTCTCHLCEGFSLRFVFLEPEPKSSQLTDGGREDLMAALKEVETDLARQKSYLDILLSVVMEKNPEILGMISDIQNKK